MVTIGRHLDRETFEGLFHPPRFIFFGRNGFRIVERKNDACVRVHDERTDKYFDIYFGDDGIVYHENGEAILDLTYHFRSVN